MGQFFVLVALEEGDAFLHLTCYRVIVFGMAKGKDFLCQVLKGNHPPRSFLKGKRGVTSGESCGEGKEGKIARKGKQATLVAHLVPWSVVASEFFDDGHQKDRT